MNNVTNRTLLSGPSRGVCTENQLRRKKWGRVFVSGPTRLLRASTLAPSPLCTFFTANHRDNSLQKPSPCSLTSFNHFTLGHSAVYREESDNFTMEEYKKYLADQILSEEKIVSYGIPMMTVKMVLTNIPGYISKPQQGTQGSCQHSKRVSSKSFIPLTTATTPDL